MPVRFADRVQESSSSQSSTTVTLSGTPPTGFQGFTSGIGNGNSCVYCIQDTAGNWEVNLGSYTSATHVLTRPTTPIASSNSGSAVASFSGTVSVFVVDPSAEASSGDWGMVSGRLYTNYFIEGHGVSTGSLGISSVRFVPVYIREWFNSCVIHVNVTVQGSGSSNMDLALYSNFANQPQILLGSQLAMATNTAGGGANGDNATSSINMPKPMSPGLYWVAWVSHSASPTIEVLNTGTTTSSKSLFGITDTTDTGQVRGWQVSTGTLPNPASGLTISTGTAPFVGVGVSL